MNTTTATATDNQVDSSNIVTEVVPRSTKSRRPALWRRIVVALVGAAGLTTAAIVLTPAPASAATSMATVRVCFDNQTHWSTFGTSWTRKVSYMLYNPSTGRWQVQATYASPTGCTYFSVHPGYRTFFEVYENWGDYYYSAQTWVYTFGSGRYYDLGWYKVTKTLTF